MDLTKYEKMVEDMRGRGLAVNGWFTIPWADGMEELMSMLKKEHDRGVDARRALRERPDSYTDEEMARITAPSAPKAPLMTAYEKKILDGICVHAALAEGAREEAYPKKLTPQEKVAIVENMHKNMRGGMNFVDALNTIDKGHLDQILHDSEIEPALEEGAREELLAKKIKEVATELKSNPVTAGESQVLVSDGKEGAWIAPKAKEHIEMKLTPASNKNMDAMKTPVATITAEEASAISEAIFGTIYKNMYDNTMQSICENAGKGLRKCTLSFYDRVEIELKDRLVEELKILGFTVGSSSTWYGGDFQGANIQISWP